jgi:hypothetical protein
VLTDRLLASLQTGEGEAALVAAREALDAEGDFLRATQVVRRSFPDGLARAAVEQAGLRRRAAAKFPAADDLFFTREGLEQASSAGVAGHRARRFRGSTVVLDLTSGIGGDALHLAPIAPVIASDTDRLRLAILRANAARRTLQDRITGIVADARLRALHPPPSSLLFADPSRRRGGRRIRRVAEMEPPLQAILAWLPLVRGGAVKLSPAVDLGELRDLPCEVEFVSEHGDLKEATLWFGELRTGTRRATVLPEEASLLDETSHELPVGPLGTHLIEPDPAVMRAGFVQPLGASLGARLLSPHIGYLTTDRATPTVFGRVFRILEADRFRLRRLKDLLAARRIGRLTIKRRGSPVDPLDLEKRLRLRGDEEATLILTRIQGVSSMILVEPVGGIPAPGFASTKSAVL